MAAALHRLLHRLLWHSHQGWIYVDDWLWRLRREEAPIQTTFIVLFLSALGCPLSYHKLDHGEETLWIGLWANFQLSAWRLPEDKFEKMKKTLVLLRDTKGTLERKDVEAGVGLIQ